MAMNLNGRQFATRGRGRPPSNNPPNGKGPPPPLPSMREVKKEKTEAEKMYYMIETADTLKEAYAILFPQNPPQKPKRYRAMFAAPPGVTPIRRSLASVKNIIRDVGTFHIVSERGDVPSAAIEKMFFTRNCPSDKVKEIRQKHFFYALHNMMIVRVNQVVVLIFQTGPLLHPLYNMSDRMNKYLASCRTRWFAANLIRLPTSPQIMAAQLLRNHGRIYSEHPSADERPTEYHKEVTRLMRACPGLDKALIPSLNQQIGSFIGFSWCKVRKDVLECMLETVNTLPTRDAKYQTSFLSAMPFNIRTIDELLRAIREQIEECKLIWGREQEQEIVLSDGPAMDDEDEDMEGGDSAGVQMQNEQPVRPTQFASSSSSAMPSLNFYHQQIVQQRTIPTTTHNVSGGMNENGRSAARIITSPQAGPSRPRPPNAYNAMENSTERRIIGQRQYETNASIPSSASIPSASARPPIQVQQERQMMQQTQSSVLPPSPSQTEYMEEKESYGQVHEQQQSQSMMPPPPTHQPFNQSTPSSQPIPHTPPTRVQERSGMMQSPFTIPSQPSTPQLFVLGPNGEAIALPTVVFVQQLDNGTMVQVQSPNPPPQFIFRTGSSERGRRMERSESRRKRRGSRDDREYERRKRSRISGWRQSDDGSSEDNTDIERREEKREREKKKKGEEEANRKIMEDSIRTAEEERLRREEEEKKRDEEDRRKKEEEERIEIERRAEELKASELEKERMADEERTKEFNEKREKEIRMEKEAEDDEGSREGVEEEVTVLAEDSGDNNEDDEEKENGEEEVVAESVGGGSGEEEEEKEKENEIIPPPSSIAVNAPSTHEDKDDSDVEIIFDGPGEKNVVGRMSMGYCEVVSVKKELNDQRRSFNQVRPPLVNAQLDSNEKRSKEVERRVKTEVKDGEDESGTEETESIRVHTGKSVVKNEVKEEEESEKKEEMEVTIIEREKEGNEDTVENTLNRSTELVEDCDKDDMENDDRGINVLEAKAQNDSSQLPAIVDNSITTLSTTTPTVSSTRPQSSESADSSLAIVSAPQDTPVLSLVVSESGTPPMPPRISSLPSNSGDGERMALPARRMSAEMVSILERSASLLLPYRGRMDEIEGRAKEREEKGKGNEQVKQIEMTKDLPLTEDGDVNTLRFHIMRGEAALLSENRKRATRDESIDSCSKALVFTNRPLFKGEKVTLKVIELSPDWKGRVRLGLTTKNPREYPTRDAIPKQLKADSGDGNITYMFDSGVRNAVNIDTIVEVELTEKGDQMNYSFDGVEMGMLGGGLQTARPMWLTVDIYGFVKGIEIVDSIFPSQPTHCIDISSANERSDEIAEECSRHVAVKTEVKEECPSQPISVHNDEMEEEPSSSLPVLTPIIPESHLGDILPLNTVPIDSIVDTVDPMEANGIVKETVATLKDVLDRVLASDEEAKEEEEMIVESVMEEEEEEEEAGNDDNVIGDAMDIEKKGDKKKKHEVEDKENEEPPMKKMRMNIETSEAMVEIDEEKEERSEKGDTIEEGNIEDEGNEINEENTVEEEIEMVEDEETELSEKIEEVNEMEENGINIDSNEGIDKEDIIDEEKKVDESNMIGVVGDNEDSEEITSELMEEIYEELLKEGRESGEERDRMESMDEMSMRDVMRDESIDDEEEDTDKMENDTDAEMTEEEEVEMETEEMTAPIGTLAPSPSRPSSPHSSPPPSPPPLLPSIVPRRRSLFGPGCCSFDQTLDAKETNEEKMEVDDEEKNETKVRPSLFGPGSASIQKIINNINNSL